MRPVISAGKKTKAYYVTRPINHLWALVHLDKYALELILSRRYTKATFDIQSKTIKNNSVMTYIEEGEVLVSNTF